MPSDRNERRPATVCAVVLAGGAARRFGSDKLAARLGSERLLDRALRGLPQDTQIIVVGPGRAVAVPAAFVREDPPGGGPAAGLVAGLRAALAGPAQLITVTPGDAPDAGVGAAALVSALNADPVSWAAVATDAAGREQPLQLALRREAGEALVAAAGGAAADGMSARHLIEVLRPRLLHVVLAAELLSDVDTPADLRLLARRIRSDQ